MKFIPKLLSLFIVVFLTVSHTVPAQAGPYTEFVKWLFLANPRHRVERMYSSVSEEQIAEANEKMANLMMQLLTESCKEKAAKAIKYEGQVALQTSFQTLGQVAAGDLFTNQDVTAVISGLEKCLDGGKLEASLGLK